jgi:hypothetical protein
VWPTSSQRSTRPKRVSRSWRPRRPCRTSPTEHGPTRGCTAPTRGSWTARRPDLGSGAGAPANTRAGQAAPTLARAAESNSAGSPRNLADCRRTITPRKSARAPTETPDNPGFGARSRYRARHSANRAKRWCITAQGKCSLMESITKAIGGPKICDAGAWRDGHRQVSVQRRGETVQDWQARDRAAGLEPGHRRLRHSCCLRQLSLAPPCLLPKRSHSTAELEKRASRRGTPAQRPTHSSAAHAAPPSSSARSSFLLHRVLLLDTPRQGSLGPLNLGPFPHPRLHEHRQQHDPPPRTRSST